MLENVGVWGHLTNKHNGIGRQPRHCLQILSATIITMSKRNDDQTLSEKQKLHKSQQNRLTCMTNQFSLRGVSLRGVFY